MLEFIEAKNIDALMFFIASRVGIILICWIFMIMSNIIDFWSGTTTAKALGEALMSKGFRRTITKIGEYVRVMLFALMFDILGSLLSFYIIPFATIIATLAVMFIEGKSVIENGRRKKAHAAEIPEIAKKIVKATTVKQATELLEQLTSITNKQLDENT